jgi:hypothetical protein
MRRLSLSLCLGLLLACGAAPVARPGDADGGTSNNGCESGFELVNGSCRDIDECAETPCDTNAFCTNTDGAFICTCKQGYVGDGAHCTLSSMPSTSSIGDECDPSNSTPNECATGLSCEQMSESGLGLCTKQCRTTPDCGQGAVCVDGSCYEQCFPDMNTCRDPAFVCYVVRAQGALPSGYCFESCVGRSADYCFDGYSCNESTGRCERHDCLHDTDCGTNKVCATTPEGMICVPDCRLTLQCPQGMTCDTSTGACRPPRP